DVDMIIDDIEDVDVIGEHTFKDTLNPYKKLHTEKMWKRCRK
ncbi:1718_t:CDS:1, partial [Entrophospora sp. SA101]